MFGVMVLVGTEVSTPRGQQRPGTVTSQWEIARHKKERILEPKGSRAHGKGAPMTPALREVWDWLTSLGLSQAQLGV